LTAQTPAPRGAWRILSTPPWTGKENMDYDRTLLTQAADGRVPPTIRFFRWKEPTVSYGRLLDPARVQPFVPSGWASVQRPTGGGIVLHQEDLCLSLCWRRDQWPYDRGLRDYYLWIHQTLQEALAPRMAVRRVSCSESAASSPREPALCFEQPVTDDLIHAGAKIAGGALFRGRAGFLYQGAIQNVPAPDAEPLLRNLFEKRFAGR